MKELISERTVGDLTIREYDVTPDIEKIALANINDILFKAKRADNGEWIFFTLYTGRLRENTAPNTAFLTLLEYHTEGIKPYVNQKEYIIILDTLSRFIGVTDTNGIKVFENDIVEDNKKERRLLCDITLSKKKRETPRSGIAVVKYGTHAVPSEDPFCWGNALGFYFDGDTIYPTPAQYYPCQEYSDFEFKVIGNIFDNPELVEELQ